MDIHGYHIPFNYILFWFIVKMFQFKLIMVFYFTSNVVDPPAIIYMGDDKEENELLIKFVVLHNRKPIIKTNLDGDGQKMFGSM